MPKTAIHATLIILLCVSSACKPSKPSASDYVGHWEGTYRADSGHEYPCHLEITTVGQSLVVKSEDQTFRPCESYAQVYSIAEDGAAKGGPMGMVTLLFDKTQNEIIVSGIPTSRRLRKDDAYHRLRGSFPGRWKKIPTDGGQMLTDVLIIEQLNDGRFSVREEEVMDNAEFHNVVYEDGRLKGTFHMAVDRDWQSPFEINTNGTNTITYRDERGEESFTKQ